MKKTKSQEEDKVTSRSFPPRAYGQCFYVKYIMRRYADNKSIESKITIARIMRCEDYEVCLVWDRLYDFLILVSVSYEVERKYIRKN